MKEKTVYYNDPLNDEFSGIGPRRKVKVDASFRYINNNIFFRAARFVLYRVIMIPIARAYCFLKFRLRIEGAEVLKQYADGGYYLYGNHTQTPGDGFIPNMIAYPKHVYFIVNPDNIAARGTKNIMMMFGTLPIPTCINGYPNFTSSISRRLEQGAVVTIYPEAHIWPYSTVIRPFGPVSFRYPARDGRPVFCFTNTYRRSPKGKPRIVSYVDGPFFSSADNERLRRNELREKVYTAMCRRAEGCDNYPFIKYVKKEEARQ